MHSTNQQTDKRIVQSITRNIWGVEGNFYWGNEGKMVSKCAKSDQKSHIQLILNGVLGFMLVMRIDQTKFEDFLKSLTITLYHCQ